MTEEIESVPASTSKLVDYVCDSDDSTKDLDFVISESYNSDHDAVCQQKIKRYDISALKEEGERKQLKEGLEENASTEEQTVETH
ncbi:hypothetical protein ILUMI_06495 [Ignelater luminosus]|uniref:Uncharacterized protein n=1 Tax=Ignelater luminosus TaxID=2038154 RepID=A0A8K0DAZ1_IGNLU|nr:hypothetical protein ILUMI_06495 [Ignelater luminosus]